MSKTVAPAVPPIIEGLATAELPEPSYLCSKLLVFVQVDRWHGTRKTGEYSNTEPVPVMESLTDTTPFSEQLQRAIAGVIENVRENPELEGDSKPA